MKSLYADLPGVSARRVHDRQLLGVPGSQPAVQHATNVGVGDRQLLGVGGSVASETATNACSSDSDRLHT
eukprot:2271615-Rhodomonas_salina.1